MKTPAVTPPTPPECCSDGQPVCWQHGKHGQLRMECRQRPHEKKNKNQNQVQGGDCLHHHSHSFVLYVMYWPRERRTAWLLRTGCRRSHVEWPLTMGHLWLARPYIIAGQPERKLSRPCVFQAASRETIPVVKEARVELTGAAHFEELGVCRRYRRRIHPGAEYPMGLRRVSGRRALRAMTRPRIGASEWGVYIFGVDTITN
jgi:hypothetical protein